MGGRNHHVHNAVRIPSVSLQQQRSGATFRRNPQKQSRLSDEALGRCLAIGLPNNPSHAEISTFREANRQTITSKSVAHTGNLF